MDETQQPLPGRVALITGANRGIGYAVAEQLAAKHGFTLIIGARDVEKGAQAAQTLRNAGFAAHAVRLDIGDADTVAEAARFVETTFDRLDVLVNNVAARRERFERHGVTR